MSAARCTLPLGSSPLTATGQIQSNMGKQPMSLESVRAFLQANAPDIELIETDESSSTVELAAKVHGVEPAQIAKTICLRVGDRTLLIVASGIARLGNRKVKDVLGGKGPNARSRAGSCRHRPSRWWCLSLWTTLATPGLLRYFAAALQRGCTRGRFGQCSA